MNLFPRFLLILLFSASFLGCKKDKEEGQSNSDRLHLSTRDMIFSGKIADSSVYWRFGSEFQRGAGVINAGINEQPLKYLSFQLTSNADLTTRFQINTPRFKSGTEALFSDLLMKGKKDIGRSPEKFELTLTLDKIDYTTVGDQTNSRLEILKVEKTQSENGINMALVWFKCSCKFYTPDEKFAFNLQNGYITAGFLYNF